MAIISDVKRKMIIADRVNGESIRSIAKKHDVSTTSVQRIIKECNTFTQIATQKKEENTADILAYMESQKRIVCEIIGKGLTALNEPEKLAEASPSQITTALGTLIDKWAMIQEKSGDGSDKVEVIIDV